MKNFNKTLSAIGILLAFQTPAALAFSSPAALDDALASVNNVTIQLESEMVEEYGPPINKSMAGKGSQDQGLSYFIQLLDDKNESVGLKHGYRAEHVEYPEDSGLTDGERYSIEVSVGNTFKNGDSGECDADGTCAQEAYDISHEAGSHKTPVEFITECKTSYNNSYGQALFKAWDWSAKPTFDFPFGGKKGVISSEGHPNIDLGNLSSTCMYTEKNGEYQLLDMNENPITECGIASPINGSVTFYECTMNFSISPDYGK